MCTMSAAGSFFINSWAGVGAPTGVRINFKRNGYGACKRLYGVFACRTGNDLSMLIFPELRLHQKGAALKHGPDP